MFRELTQDYQSLNDQWLTEIKIDRIERQQKLSSHYNFDFESNAPGLENDSTISWTVSEKEPLGVGKIRKTFLDLADLSSLLSNVDIKVKN